MSAIAIVHQISETTFSTSHILKMVKSNGMNSVNLNINQYGLLVIYF